MRTRAARFAGIGCHEVWSTAISGARGTTATDRSGAAGFAAGGLGFARTGGGLGFGSAFARTGGALGFVGTVADGHQIIPISVTGVFDTDTGDLLRPIVLPTVCAGASSE